MNIRNEVGAPTMGWKSFKVYHIGWKRPSHYCSPFLPYILIPKLSKVSRGWYFKSLQFYIPSQSSINVSLHGKKNKKMWCCDKILVHLKKFKLNKHQLQYFYKDKKILLTISNHFIIQVVGINITFTRTKGLTKQLLINVLQHPSRNTTWTRT